MSKKSNIQNKNIYELQADICSALASPVRLQILELIASGEKTSTQLLEEIDIPKTNMSQHLAVLRDAGIIQTRKVGLYQYLSLALPKIKDACSIVKGILAEKIEHEEAQRAELRRQLKSQR